MPVKPQPNNGMRPTALSLAFINLASRDAVYVVASGGKRWRAFGGFADMQKATRM